MLHRFPTPTSSILTKSLRGRIATQPLKASAAYLPRNNFARQTQRLSPPRVRTYAIMSTQSHACCTVPPVQVDYKEKGSFTQVEGMKTYQTGSSSAKSGLLIVYDIFGFFPQTLQGADILASGDKDKPRQVFMPGEPRPAQALRNGVADLLFQTSLMASQRTSPGTRRTTTRRARSWASSSQAKPHRPRLSSASPRFSRSFRPSTVSPNGASSATAGAARS